MNPALSERLQLARRRLFVGRTTELRDWAVALDAPTWNIPIWHIHGLGGIGKTSLLREWRSEARARGVVVLPLDARDFDPTIDAVCGALRELLNAIPGNELAAMAGPSELCAAMDAMDSRLVVQIDTFELLEPLDDWLRESFLPQLPSNVAVNIAGRNSLSMAWHGDAGWHELLRSFDLGALSPRESTDYLEKRGVASRAQANLRSWAHGHPLALSLAADIWLQRPDEARVDLKENSELEPNSFQPGEVPQLVGSLLGHLISEVPTKWHRAALEACATVSVLSEELLGELLAPLNGQGEAPDSRSLFEWLRSLSIIQANRFGLFPHDLAREVLVADLRWRNPQWHGQLHKGARQYYLRHIHHSSGGEQQRAIFDCLFLHRMSPAVAPYLQWNDSRSSLEPGRGADIEACLEWVERHEGQQSRHIASRWFSSQPENLTVVRNPGGQPQGFVFQLALHSATPAEIESDPATRAAWHYLQEHAPLRSGERSTLFRFWMDKDEYQNVGATQSLIFVQAARHYLTTPQLAFTFFPCAAPEFWSLGFGYADLERVEAADFEVEGHRYGTFCHDWRSRPVLAWIDLLTQREIHSVDIEATPVPEPTKEAPFLVLDEASFGIAVRQALRGWSDPVLLRRNPLLQTSLVQRRARHLAGQGKQPTSDEAVLALRSLLRQAVVALAAASRQDKSYHALELVYGRRTLSQESAADVMNVSHSSFRRYLRSALTFISESLWQLEMARLDNGHDFLAVNDENEHHLTLF
jgi:hypothetical protein